MNTLEVSLFVALSVLFWNIPDVFGQSLPIVPRFPAPWPPYTIIRVPVVQYEQPDVTNEEHLERYGGYDEQDSQQDNTMRRLPSATHHQPQYEQPIASRVSSDKQQSADFDGHQYRQQSHERGNEENMSSDNHESRHDYHRHGDSDYEGNVSLEETQIQEPMTSDVRHFQNYRHPVLPQHPPVWSEYAEDAQTQLPLYDAGFPENGFVPEEPPKPEGKSTKYGIIPQNRNIGVTTERPQRSPTSNKTTYEYDHPKSNPLSNPSTSKPRVQPVQRRRQPIPYRNLDSYSQVAQNQFSQQNPLSDRQRASDHTSQDPKVRRVAKAPSKTFEIQGRSHQRGSSPRPEDTKQDKSTTTTRSSDPTDVTEGGKNAQN